VTAQPFPPHLQGYETLYEQEPRQAARKWFSEAKFGLFVHYALCSLVERGKPGLLEMLGGSRDLLSLLEKSPVEIEAAGLPEDEIRRGLEVKRDLLSRFTAAKFDAEAICDLAEAASMRYVTLTTKHLGGLHLFDTSVSEFNSMNTGPRGDGSIHPDDDQALREVGRRIREEGFPRA